MAAGRVRRGKFTGSGAICCGMEHHRHRNRSSHTRWETITDRLGACKPLELILLMVSGITLIAALHAMWSA